MFCTCVQPGRPLHESAPRDGRMHPKIHQYSVEEVLQLLVCVHKRSGLVVDPRLSECLHIFVCANIHGSSFKTSAGSC